MRCCPHTPTTHVRRHCPAKKRRDSLPRYSIQGTFQISETGLLQTALRPENDRLPKRSDPSNLAHRGLWHSERCAIRLGHDGTPQTSICCMPVPVSVFVACCLTCLCTSNPISFVNTLVTLTLHCNSNAHHKQTHHSDLKCVLGGSKTLLATTFLHMLQTLYSTYKIRLSDLTFFENIMSTCVDLLNNLCHKHNNMAMPYDNAVGFVDGHLQVWLPPHQHPHRTFPLTNLHLTYRPPCTPTSGK